MRAKLVLAVPGGPSRTKWFSLVLEVFCACAASSQRRLSETGRNSTPPHDHTTVTGRT
jgi:hypothetical protein